MMTERDKALNKYKRTKPEAHLQYYKDLPGSFAANGAASLPTAWPAATHLPAWKKLLKRIGGQSFGDLGKMMAVMKGNIASGKFGKSREGSNRFGNSRNRFLAPESMMKDTKHGVSSLRESSGKIGSARIVSGIVAIDSSHLKI
ncbi:hypothetical protein NQ317_007627 [Molorchus minor]|uniref:Uncharacterized protein n=1 Tax=Molorchus minor TaxID=1323400 RepID=A0ABQ9J7V3_9CUCU|nr:hypothetical protein NQ317_007627 [Molorchus minor]